MKTLRDVGQSVARVVPWARPLMRSAYGHLPECWKDTPASWARKFFRDAQSVRFVQIGAFDGIADDPIRDLIIESTVWNGLLIEPQPAVFEKLKKNYVGQSERLSFLNCAISRVRGSIELHTIQESEIERLNLGVWAREIASLDPSQIEKRMPGVATQVITVNALSFDDAVRGFGIDIVDCLVIDAEGYDFEIIKSIDLMKYKIRFLIYEHAHLSDMDAADAEALLIRHGFVLRSFGYDTIAWRH